MRDHDHGDERARHDAGVEVQEQHGRDGDEEAEHVDGTDLRPAAARAAGAAVRATVVGHKFSGISRSTMTTSRQTPSSLPCFSYVPTSRKPMPRSRARLAAFSTNTRETSFHSPAFAAASISASIATR